MVKKEFTFRGHLLDDLLRMQDKEFAGLICSRSRRTLLRSGIDKKLDGKIAKAHALLQQEKEAKPIRTHLRNTIVVPRMVGLRFAVHRGNSFEIVAITKDMLGHFLGEFALTRKKLMHGRAGIGATKSSTAITARG